MLFPAVVFVHYRLPWRRMVEHLEWNAAVYQAAGVKVFVVTAEAPPALPSWAEALIFPRHLATFSLTRTCNFGIRHAIDAGFGPIVKTDSDMVFPADTLAECCAVGAGEAVAPCYQMVNSYQERHTWRNRLEAPLALGTISMGAPGWEKVCGYDERLEGYGCDDGDIWARIGAAGLRRVRGLGIYHIAHVAGVVQQEAHCVGDKAKGVRTDHHNRDGINPNRLRENRAILRRGAWKSADWGLEK